MLNVNNLAFVFTTCSAQGSSRHFFENYYKHSTGCFFCQLWTCLFQEFARSQLWLFRDDRFIGTKGEIKKQTNTKLAIITTENSFQVALTEILIC